MTGLDRQQISSILRKNQLRAQKKFGQNFLHDINIINAILNKADLTPQDTIIELGVGLGSLTLPLAAQVQRVIGIEIDNGIIAWHQENRTFPDNVTLIHQDLLTVDYGQLARETGTRLKIVANLPYSISNPLLFKLLDYRHDIASAMLMLQKEVAIRLTAPPGTKEYGILSVLLASAAKIEKVLSLGPQHFHPRPKVDSAVVRLTFDPLPSTVAQLPAHDFKRLKSVVKKAFQTRRKTIVNALSGHEAFVSKEHLQATLDRAGISRSIRPDQLTLHAYIDLCNAIDQKNA